MNFKSIFMNEVDYIHTCDPLTIKVNAVKYEYLFEFSEVKHVATLFDLIYKKIPCFNWDLIITNFRLNNFCLLNINYSRINQSNDNEEDDEESEINAIQFIPPPMRRIGGQSTSNMDI